MLRWRSRAVRNESAALTGTLAARALQRQACLLRYITVEEIEFLSTTHEESHRKLTENLSRSIDIVGVLQGCRLLRTTGRRFTQNTAYFSAF